MRGSDWNLANDFSLSIRKLTKYNVLGQNQSV